MTTYEEAIAALHQVSESVDRAVKAIRAVDKLQPTQVRFFNGEVDDMHADFAKIQPARERLLQRTQTGAPPDIAVPENAGAFDGLRA